MPLSCLACKLNGPGRTHEQTHDGGCAEYVRVPADWVMPLPDGLDLRQTMALGTAGFTAGLAVQRLEDNHQRPEIGPLVVTGASGGVGSFAVDILSGLGYEVVAVTGKPQATAYLEDLGASHVVSRQDLEMRGRPLENAQWGGALDNVGGEIRRNTIGAREYATRPVFRVGGLCA